jgi:polyisoprenoid-binding protein YceI
MNTTKALSALALALMSTSPALAENVAGSAASNATAWAIDAAHTHIGFSVPHMVISEVAGHFTKFTGTVLLDEKDPTKSQLEFRAEVASITTDNADRDKHLQSPDFFDAKAFPAVTFKSTKITKSGKGYKIAGDLTIHGITKRVTLEATLSAAVTSPWGKQVRAAKISGKIKRQDFGLTWNKALDKGGVLVGDEVTLGVTVELNK